MAKKARTTTMTTESQTAQEDTLEQIAERIFELSQHSIVDGEVKQAIVAALRNEREARDERAVRIIDEHRAMDICNDNCWTAIKATIRGWTEANTELSDEQIDEFENVMREQFVLSHPGLMLNLSMVCQTVKALRADKELLATVSGEWAILLDRIRVWSKCKAGYPLDEHINNITVTNERLQSRLSEVERERDTWRSRAERWQKEKDEMMADFTKALRKL